MRPGTWPSASGSASWGSSDEGAEPLGLSGGYLRRNARGWVGSGVCAFGCPAGAKQHTGVTFVPCGWEHGAVLFTDATVRDLTRRGDRITEVVATTSAGGMLRVRADLFVVACGTIGTPILLRRNGLGTASGQLGRNLSIHPAGAIRARMDHEVRMGEGVPQSYDVDAFAADGSVVPSSPGVNPQLTIMALATRAARRIVARG